jgi:uncharacterized protein YbcI
VRPVPLDAIVPLVVSQHEGGYWPLRWDNSSCPSGVVLLPLAWRYLRRTESSDQMDDSPPQIGHSDKRGLELQELTNAMVRLYKELFGRGPTKARTDYAGPDALVATIQNSLTSAERNLVGLGEDQRVREIRMFFQHASEHEFEETVEQITGRKVWAFVSGIDIAHDVSSEVFYLEPIPGA